MYGRLGGLVTLGPLPTPLARTTLEGRTYKGTKKQSGAILVGVWYKEVF